MRRRNSSNRPTSIMTIIGTVCTKPLEVSYGLGCENMGQIGLYAYLLIYLLKEVERIKTVISVMIHYHYTNKSVVTSCKGFKRLLWIK